MQLKFKILILMIFIDLCACQPMGSFSTLTPSTISTSTNIPRWVMYEDALLKATVRNDDGLCEWEIMGVSDKQVYVWALCKVRGPIGTAMSVPAVIYLGENGVLEKVVIPRDGHYGEDVIALFPPEIQKKIFSRELQGFIDMEHLEVRLKSGGPPLIVVSGTPQP